ncbi:MAG: DUF1553 domain-containing protein, partial [Planctomycetota bacterium]
AAVFAKMETTGRHVRGKPLGRVTHPRTLEDALPRIPGEKFLPRSDDDRKAFTDWLTSSGNPYFAKALVNRIWKALMGRGLVEPTDDFRATNPATHPELLDLLARDFEKNGYRLRPTIRSIVTSASYSRTYRASEANRDDGRFYSHALARPLEAEVLADALSDALGVAELYGDEALGTRALALLDPATPSRSLDVLGRCSRESSCEADPVPAGGLAQKLHLLNGGLLNARIRADGGRLDKLLRSKTTNESIVEELYLATLSRFPSEKEREHWRRALRELDSKEDRNAFFEDLAWGLLTCNEFVRRR